MLMLMLMHVSFYHPLGDTMSDMTVLLPQLSLPFPLTHRSDIRIIRKGRVTIHELYGRHLQPARLGGVSLQPAPPQNTAQCTCPSPPNANNLTPRPNPSEATAQLASDFFPFFLPFPLFGASATVVELSRTSSSSRPSNRFSFSPLLMKKLRSRFCS